MVKQVRLFLSLLLLALVPVIGGGCGGMNEVCIEANSAIGKAGAYVDEAQMAVARARKIAEVMPDAIKGEAIKAVNAAEASLYGVTQFAATISEQCASFDLPSMFKDFANTWDGVKAILDKTGGDASGIIDPKAYALGKSAS